MQYILLLILSFILLFLTRVISVRLNLFDVPDNFKIHKQKVPNIAGLALIPFSFFIIFYFEFNNIIIKTLYLFIIVVLIGLIDDINNITIMSIDNLASELPRDSSDYFGRKLINEILPLFINDENNILLNATITNKGKLLKKYK